MLRKNTSSLVLSSAAALYSLWQTCKNSFWSFIVEKNIYYVEHRQTYSTWKNYFEQTIQREKWNSKINTWFNVILAESFQGYWVIATHLKFVQQLINTVIKIRFNLWVWVKAPHMVPLSSECCMSLFYPSLWVCFFFTFNPSSFRPTNFSLSPLLKLIRDNNHSCTFTALHSHATGWAVCDSKMARQMDYIPVVDASLAAIRRTCLMKACQNSCRVLGLRSPHWGRDQIMSASALSHAR